MSDLSLNEEINPAVGEKLAALPLNFKNVERKTEKKYGRNLTVEEPQAISSAVSSDGELEELLLANASGNSSLPSASPNQHSPMLRPTPVPAESFKSSPRLIRQPQIHSTSPHGSPKASRLPAVSFFMGSDGSVRNINEMILLTES